MAEIKFSQLTTAAQLTNDDIFALAQMQGGSLSSVKTSMIAVANYLNTQVQYTNAYNTQAKTTAGAINELKQLISLIPQFSIEVVEELPTEDISDTTIYLVPSSDPQTQNVYDEFIHIDNAWEQIGSTTIDLSAYYTKLEVDAKFNALATVATSGSYNDLTNKPDLSALMDVNETTFTNPYTKKLVPSGKYTEKLKKLVGASVVWNQLVQNGNFANTSVWQTINASLSVSGGIGTFTSSSTNMAIFQSRPERSVNHIYRIVFEHSVDSGTQDVVLYWGSSSVLTVTASTTKTRVEKIIKITTESANVNLNFAVNGIGSGGKYNISAVQLTDLTAMFGTTIADYVYTLETQTAGSGIAWLKSYGFFTKDYYAYSANTMQSVSVSGKKNVGKNKLCLTIRSASTVSGVISEVKADNNIVASGNAGTNADIICYLDTPTTLTSGNTYTFSFSGTDTRGGAIYLFVGTPGVNVGTININNHSVSFTPSADIYLDKIRLRMNSGSVNINAKAMLELGSTATAYKPYTEPTTYPLDHTELRGLFKLDANNNLYADGDEYPSDGNGSVKYAEVDLGNYNWTYASSLQAFYTDEISGVKRTSGDAETPTWLMCESYMQRSVNNLILGRTNMTIGVASNGRVWLSNSSYTDGAQLKTALSGCHFQFEKATPTTATLTPYEKLQPIEQGGTEEFVDNGVQSGTRDVAIPAGNETAYGDNELMGKVINYIND